MEPKARNFVDDLRGRGRHSFTREDARTALRSTPVAVYHALRRLEQQGALAMPRRGFYLIVDPEYRTLGALPPTVWIDDLMRYLNASYYVGLLSAAAHYGAAHQAPQEFQVITNTILRPLTVGRVRIRFFFSRHLNRVAKEQMKTPSGPIPVSSPEATAFDLIRYRQGAGSIDHVGTVISELAESLKPQRLVDIASQGEPMPVIQRLGYLLDLAGHTSISDGLASFVEERMPKTVPLEPLSKEAVMSRDPKWRLAINTTVDLEA